MKNDSQRLRRSLAAAQNLLALPLPCRQGRAAADGNCFYRSIGALTGRDWRSVREMGTGSREGDSWAGESEILQVATVLGLRITFWPVEMTVAAPLGAFCGRQHDSGRADHTTKPAMACCKLQLWVHHRCARRCKKEYRSVEGLPEEAALASVAARL